MGKKSRTKRNRWLTEEDSKISNEINGWVKKVENGETQENYHSAWVGGGTIERVSIPYNNLIL